MRKRRIPGEIGSRRKGADRGDPKSPDIDTVAHDPWEDRGLLETAIEHEQRK
jgi:hypothetical protein